MKKTLIVLAIAATAAVSGSAMAAWEANGSGGTIDIGGTLTPVVKATPWETLAGSGVPVTDLDTQIQKGETKVAVTINKAIPVLAIRSTDLAGFVGKAGIAPQINYSWVSNDGFTGNIAPALSEVTDSHGSKIGSAAFSLTAQARAASSKLDGSLPDERLLIAAVPGNAFFGGLPKVKTGVTDILSQVGEAFSDIGSKYTNFGSNKWLETASNSMSNPGWKFSSYYGSFIAQNSKVNITLDSPAKGDAAIEWKVTLPVAVTYQ